MVAPPPRSSPKSLCFETGGSGSLVAALVAALAVRTGGGGAWRVGVSGLGGAVIAIVVTGVAVSGVSEVGKFDAGGEAAGALAVWCSRLGRESSGRCGGLLFDRASHIVNGAFKHSDAPGAQRSYL